MDYVYGVCGWFKLFLNPKNGNFHPHLILISFPIFCSISIDVFNFKIRIFWNWIFIYIYKFKFSTKFLLRQILCLVKLKNMNIEPIREIIIFCQSPRTKRTKRIIRKSFKGFSSETIESFSSFLIWFYSRFCFNWFSLFWSKVRNQFLWTRIRSEFWKTNACVSLSATK